MCLDMFFGFILFVSFNFLILQIDLFCLLSALSNSLQSTIAKLQTVFIIQVFLLMSFFHSKIQPSIITLHLDIMFPQFPFNDDHFSFHFFVFKILKHISQITYRPPSLYLDISKHHRGGVLFILLYQDQHDVHMIPSQS